jgi:hypothetical protein
MPTYFHIGAGGSLQSIFLTKKNRFNCRKCKRTLTQSEELQDRPLTKQRRSQSACGCCCNKSIESYSSEDSVLCVHGQTEYEMSTCVPSSNKMFALGNDRDNNIVMCSGVVGLRPRILGALFKYQVSHIYETNK